MPANGYFRSWGVGGFHTCWYDWKREKNLFWARYAHNVRLKLDCRAESLPPSWPLFDSGWHLRWHYDMHGGRWGHEVLSKFNTESWTTKDQRIWKSPKQWERNGNKQTKITSTILVHKFKTCFCSCSCYCYCTVVLVIVVLILALVAASCLSLAFTALIVIACVVHLFLSLLLNKLNFLDKNTRHFARIDRDARS